VKSSKKREFISPRDFINEAQYDLELAEMILECKQIRLEKCGSDKDTFYLGRRALYMLQQAVEKATKAYYLALFKVLVDHLVDLAQLCRKINPKAKDIETRLRRLSNRLEPSQVSHAPHRVLIDIMRSLNEVANSELFASCMEYMINYISEGFEALKALSPQTKQEIEEIEVWIKERVSKAIAIYKESKPVEFKNPENIPRVPPCINNDVLNALKEWRRVKLKQMINIGEEKFREEFEHLRSIKPSLIRIFTSTSKISTSEAENLVDSYLSRASLLHYILFSKYLAPFIIYVSPCLRWYEEGGRYPDSKIYGYVHVNEKREEICMDLKNIELLTEEVRYIVKEVEKSVEEYELLFHK